MKRPYLLFKHKQTSLMKSVRSEKWAWRCEIFFAVRITAALFSQLRGNLHLESDEDINSFLFEDMRFDQKTLFSLDLKQLNEIDRIVKNPQITMIFQYLQKRSRL